MTHTHMCQFWETSKDFAFSNSALTFLKWVVVIMPPQTSYWNCVGAFTVFFPVAPRVPMVDIQNLGLFLYQDICFISTAWANTAFTTSLNATLSNFSSTNILGFKPVSYALLGFLHCCDVHPNIVCHL